MAVSRAFLWSALRHSLAKTVPDHRDCRISGAERQPPSAGNALKNAIRGEVFVKRSTFACLLLAGISTQALADDLSITSKITSPVSTATASNNSPGNITIQQGGSVDVSVQGAAVTL